MASLRVPTVSGPSVESRSLETPFQRTSASPGLLHNPQVEQAGRALMETGIAIQERQDADELMRAETEVKSKYLEWAGEARQRKGQQAWGVAKEAGEWWDKEAAKVGESIKSERARQVFQREVMKHRGASIGEFSGHEAGQRRASLTESTQASIVGSINMAAANPGNVEVAGAAKADIIKRTQMLAQLNGWAPEMAQAKQTEYLTNFHKQILQGLVDRDPKAASDYFTLNKGEIEGSQHSEIDRVLKVGVSLRNSQEFADQVMSSGMTEADALAQARQKFEGDNEKAVVAEIKTRFAEVSAARERQQRTAADQAYAVYARSGTLNSIPPSVLSQLDGRDLLALRRAHDEQIDRIARREVKYPTTDWDKYYALRREALSNPEAFKERDLRREFPYLGKVEREGLIDLQGKKGDELKDTATLDQQLSNTHDILKLGGSGNQEKRGRFDQAVTDAIRTEEKRMGKKLDYDGRQKIIDRMVIEGEVTRNWLPDSRKRLYEVVNTEDAGRFVATVPKGEREKIEGALRRAGQPVTDAAVQQLYLQKHGAK
jgi:hypothetical protein